MYQNIDDECKSAFENSHFEKVQNKARTPASRFAWALLALSTEFTKHKQDRAACLYATVAVDVGTHLFSPTRKELWAQILRIWVPSLFSAGVKTMTQCGVTQKKIEF